MCAVYIRYVRLLVPLISPRSSVNSPQLSSAPGLGNRTLWHESSVGLTLRWPEIIELEKSVATGVEARPCRVTELRKLNSTAEWVSSLDNKLLLLVLGHRYLLESNREVNWNSIGPRDDALETAVVKQLTLRPTTYALQPRIYLQGLSSQLRVSTPHTPVPGPHGHGICVHFGCDGGELP